MHPFTPHADATVSAWGETKLIQSIRRWLGTSNPPPPFGIGNDCAVLPASHRRQLITVDPVIFGRHFDETVAPRAVGAKLLKRNLSDLAAMGGRPTAAVLALTLDPRVSRDWLEAFYRGLAQTARRYHVPIVGGDLAQANGVVAASLTLLGEAQGERVLTRTGAKVGDWIYVTGALGGSLASGRHFRFSPRLREGGWLAQRPEVRAMLDLSDGLAKDIHALTPPGAVPALQARQLPRHRGADLKAALTDGEDYELLFALNKNADQRAFARAWRREFPRLRVTCIGCFARNGQQLDTALRIADYHGYEHLR
ncbi:MAG: hypothetical protein RL077_5262 [Verrucomicrobiota bacterium]|jgi:thiamine-monophosphate kinase